MLRQMHYLDAIWSSNVGLSRYHVGSIGTHCGQKRVLTQFIGLPFGHWKVDSPSLDLLFSPMGCYTSKIGWLFPLIRVGTAVCLRVPFDPLGRTCRCLSNLSSFGLECVLAKYDENNCPFHGGMFGLSEKQRGYTCRVNSTLTHPESRLGRCKHGFYHGPFPFAILGCHSGRCQQIIESSPFIGLTTPIPPVWWPRFLHGR